MATAKWATPGTRSSDLSGSVINIASFTTGTESGTMTYDNSTAKDLYGTVTVKLASLTPTAGGSLSIRVQYNDGTDTPDGKVGGDIYTSLVTTTTGAKVTIFNLVRLYPYSMRFSLFNTTGSSIASTGNNFYVRPWNEDVS